MLLVPVLGIPDETHSKGARKGKLMMMRLMTPAGMRPCTSGEMRGPLRARPTSRSTSSWSEARCAGGPAGRLG
jgi:hypothetical protein